LSKYFRLIALAKQYKWLVFFATLATLLSAVLDALLIAFIKDIINRGFVERNERFLTLFPIYIIIFFSARAVAGYGSEYLIKRSEYNVLAELRNKFSHVLMHLPKNFFDQQSLGEIQSTFGLRIQMVAEGATRIPLCYLREFLLAILLVVIMFIESWQLSSIALIAMPVVYTLYRYTASLLRAVSGKVQKDDGDMMQLAGQVFANTEMIRSYHALAFFQKRFSALIESHQDSSIISAHYSALLSASLYMVTSVPLAFMMWWLYHYGVMPSVGSVAAILIALMRIIHPLRLISELTHLFQKSVVAHAAFNRMINVDLKLPDCQMVDHGIEVEHICYQLGSEMILKDVSLVFPEKEKVAIVGSSGAGKSTLLKMIASIYEPSFGLIKSNASVTYVRQESWLFTASVRENLMFDKVDQEGLIEKVLKDLDMYEWVMSLPNQLDTIIGQGEAMMSGGQMQRLCLARAILKSSQYLLLDEITSALDRVTEKLVMNTILNSEQAVILVTHRLNYLSQFDRVVFMEGGEVVATGHFSDLLNQSQAFKNFYHRLSNQG
jgi:subfamily B ATP-binding cassette protein MsbA